MTETNPAKKELMGVPSDGLVIEIDREAFGDAVRLEEVMMQATARINATFEAMRTPEEHEETPLAIVLDAPGAENLGALIPRSLAYLRRKTLEELIDGICAQKHLKSVSELVREDLLRLRLLLDFVMTLEIDFQIFVQSNADSKVQGWIESSRHRIRSIRQVTTLRRQFVVVVILAWIVFALPFYLDGRAPRAGLVELEAAGVHALDIEHVLHEEMQRREIGWLDRLPLPGTAAMQTTRDVRQIWAMWRAERFVRERLLVASPSDSLGAWANAMARSRGPEDVPFEGWNLLPNDSRGVLRRAVDDAIYARNLSAMAELERLVDGKPIPAGIDAGSPTATADALLASMVSPSNLDLRNEQLWDRAEQRRRTLDAPAKERSASIAAARFLESVEDSFLGSAVQLEDVEEWLAAVRPRIERLRGAGMQENANHLVAVEGQLKLVRLGLQARSARDGAAFATAMEQLQDSRLPGLTAVRSWARQRIAEARAAFRSRSAG